MLEIAAIADAPPADVGTEPFQLYLADPTPADGKTQGDFNTTRAAEELAGVQAEGRAIYDG